MEMQAALPADLHVIHPRLRRRVKGPQAHGPATVSRAVAQNVGAMENRGHPRLGPRANTGLIQTLCGLQPQECQRQECKHSPHQASGVKPITMSNLAASSPMREVLIGAKSMVTAASALGSLIDL